MNRYLANKWTIIAGSSSEFSMENRIFNAICFTCLAVLIVFLPINFFLGLPNLVLLTFIFIIVQAIVFYFSRYKKRFQTGVILYGIGSYSLLVINFFVNAGIDGPTIIGFLFTFHLLLAIAPSKVKYLWLALHILILGTLLYCDYFNYPTKIERYEKLLYRNVDVYTTYIGTLVFTFLITGFIRHSYEKARHLSEERAKKLELQRAELEQVNNQKDKLFTIIGSDIKTPLNLIKGYMGILTNTNQIFSVDESKAFQKKLEVTINNTSLMIDNLLSWSRINLHEQTYTTDKVDFVFLVKDAVQYFESYALFKSVNLHVKTVHPCNIFANKADLKQVIANILHNAIKYSKANANVYINLYFNTNRGCLSIKDEGPGIDDATLKRLFEWNVPLTSLEATKNKTAEKGTGLGLMLCKKMVEAAKGTIEIQSKSTVGTTVTICFALAG